MKFGAPILTSELSGSLGGVVASSARGGVGYFRVRARPGNPRAIAQTTVRTILAGLASLWRSTLTALQRTGWAALAASGESGIDAYARANFQARLAGELATNTPPVSIGLDDPTILTAAVVDASAHTVTPTTFTGTVTRSMNVYVSRPQNASRLSQQFGFTYAGTIKEGNTFITLAATHPAFNLTAGDVVYVRCVEFGEVGEEDAARVAIAQEFRSIVVA